MEALGNETKSLLHFPIFRSLLAGVIVPISIVVIPEYIAEALQPGLHFTFWDLYSIPAAAFYFAIPGYVVFLILGIPTMYFLYRWNRLGFGWFALVGVLYASLAFAVLGSGIYP